MKILHINTYQWGGAAWCAIRICRALSEIGIDSQMLFAEGSSMPEGIDGDIAKADRIIWNENRVLNKVRNLAKRFGIWFSHTEKLQNQIDKANFQHLYLHSPLSNYKNIANHPLIEWADIIHLHWVTGFIDYPSFFKNVKKPIVWTLHDKYPAVGLQHYASENFPVPVELQAIDEYCRKIKCSSLKLCKNLNVVAISDETKRICHESEVLRDFPITLIHNGVDTSKFKRYDRNTSRKELGLLPEAKIFMFSSHGLADANKGLDRVIKALEKANVPNKMLVCIGILSSNPLPDASFPIILTGLLKNHEKLAKYYSSSDYFIQASYEETFAQTPLEAMACGTPVISTPCSGASDLIHPFNGVICNGYDADAIVEGINDAIRHEYNADEIRQHIVDNYQYSKIALHYKELYEKVL